MTGDITSYLDKNNYLVNVEGPDGKPRKAILIADSKAADPFASQPVNIVENQSPAVEHFMYEELNDIVIQGTPVRFTDIIDLDPGHGFLNPAGLDSDFLNIHYVDPLDKSFVGTRFSQHVVTNVNVNQISITPPLAYDLDPSKIEFSKRVNVNMAVLATRASKIKFVSYPPNGAVWELRRFMPSMILSTAGDDGLFGNIARLVNGEFFGFENPEFSEYNVFIFDNGDFASTAYDVKYPTRSGGGGSYGMNVRKTVAGLDKSGVIITLDGTTSDIFVKYSQDDLTGIARYRVKVIGDIKSA